MGYVEGGTLAGEGSPVNRLAYLWYGISYVFNRQMMHGNIPLIAGLTLTNACNLRCRHCRVTGREAGDLGFRDAAAILDSFYEKGGRMVYLQGGEPFLWKDGRYRMEDIVDYARRKGFLSTVVFTNGTMPLETSASTVFVSVDGLRETHDYLRGETFERIMTNILESRHPSLFINYTINTYNKDEIEAFCEYIATVSWIRGTFFYFHTPYYGYDDLYLGPEERAPVLRKLLVLQKNYRILNSRAGLQSALKNNWKRPLDICLVYEKGAVYRCCRYPGDPELCRNCGYLSYPEIDRVLNLKPSAVINALKYF